MKQVKLAYYVVSTIGTLYKLESYSKAAFLKPCRKDWTDM